MLSEFIDKIAAMAKASITADVVETPIPRRLLLRNGPTGAAEWIDAPPKPRAHHIDSYDDIVALVQDKTIAPAPEVFHDSATIAVVLDREQRDAKVLMNLYSTDRMNNLVALGPGKALGVAEALRLLRFDLHGVGAETLIPALQRIDFKRTGVSVGAAKHGVETLGRTVEAAVQQADQVPETFHVEMPIYRNSGLRGVSATIECGIYLDVMNERVVIRPLADEIESAWREAIDEVHDMLLRDLPGVPCFRGTVC